MKKQLLLGLFIAIIFYAPTQASIRQAALRVEGNLEPASISQKSVNYLTSSRFMPASQSLSIQGLDQPSNPTAQETATPTSTQPAEKKNLSPTRTPRPTSTPMVIPPSANPSTTTLMILVSLIAVIVVVVGVWLNRPEK
jgi:hypothetical protein